MKPLRLDFAAARRASPWLGRGLVALAIAVCVDAGLGYQKARQAVQEAEARLARRASAASGPKASAQELAAVRETVQRLSLPWNELFSALEAAADNKVALAAIEPDSAKGTVTITGDGKDYLAALSYVSNLSRNDALQGVQLVRHEHKANDPNGPVSFSVSAAWTAK